MNSTNKKAPGASLIPQPFNRQAGHSPQLKPVVAQLRRVVSAQSVKTPVAPPAYRPQPTPNAVQPKMAHDALNRKPPVAPPVYRLQQATKVLQTKSSAGQTRQADQVPRGPVAPPVYRPQAKKIVQPQTCLHVRKPPTALPVYRPEQKRVAQPKMSRAAPGHAQPKALPACRPQPKQPNLQAKMKAPTEHPVSRPQQAPGVLRTNSSPSRFSQHEAGLDQAHFGPRPVSAYREERPLHPRYSGGVLQLVRKKQTHPRKKPSSEQGTEIIVNKSQLDLRKIYWFLNHYKVPSPSSFKIRKTGQRIEVEAKGSAILQNQLLSRKKRGKKYIDPSYHETVQYINLEYAHFYKTAEHILNPWEIHVAYDLLLQRHRASFSLCRTKLNSCGPSQLTTMTPQLLELYHTAHYAETLVHENETSSTRIYEARFGRTVYQSLPFSCWRPFVLPASSSAEETTLVNAIGGTLDAQVPTSGKTVGQGKIYSAVYKHFQKSMELLNQHLDDQFGKYSSDAIGAFEARTKLHSKMLDQEFLKGLYHNEKNNFSVDSGYASWNELWRAIDTLLILISASLDMVPEEPEKDFQMMISLSDLKGSQQAIVKQIELIATIIGLMIKKEKRLALNALLLGKGKLVQDCLINLYQLQRVEAILNKEFVASQGRFGKMMRQNQDRKSVTKDLMSLK